MWKVTPKLSLVGNTDTIQMPLYYFSIEETHVLRMELKAERTDTQLACYQESSS